MSDTDTLTTRLRAAADWLETTDLPDDVTVIMGQGVTVSLFCHTYESFRAVRRIVGKVTKEAGYGAYGMTLTGTVADVVPVKIWPPAGACERVQVGTTQRPVLVESGEVEQVPVYEWDCGPVLAEVNA